MNRTAYSLPLRFLAISIAVHLCLLAVFGNLLLTAPTVTLGESVLEISFSDYSPTKTAAANPIASEYAAHAISPAETAAGSYPSISVADTRQRATAPITDTREKLHNHLLGVLRTRLSQYLTYPPLARDRGWEGKVLLGLSVEPDGQFNKIRIERSSGYAVLDDSALNSLKRLGNIVEARDWLEGHSIEMQLPVIYRLMDN